MVSMKNTRVDFMKLKVQDNINEQIIGLITL